MLAMIQFTNIREGIIECTLDLNGLYTNKELEKFNKRWKEFVDTDEANASIIRRIENAIFYTHKSWIPSKKDNRPSVLMLFGNPASHSVRADIYFAYEGKGTEHRFWKVFRELGIVNINTDPQTIKQDFFNLKYDSPFRLGTMRYRRALRGGRPGDRHGRGAGRRPQRRRRWRACPEAPRGAAWRRDTRPRRDGPGASRAGWRGRPAWPTSSPTAC